MVEVSYRPGTPQQGQLFHHCLLGSASGGTVGRPRALKSSCICGWECVQTTGIQRGAYKKQIQDLYNGHIRDVLDCQTLFAIGPSV